MGKKLTPRVQLRVVLMQPPVGVDYGLQEGRGNAYKTIQTQRSAGKDLTFDFAIETKPGKTPSFTGPLVQGPAGDKFFYIDIGIYAGQKDSPLGGGRLKIPLCGITKEMIDSGKILEARIPGTAKKGGPSYAYTWLKEAGGSWTWKVFP